MKKVDFRCSDSGSLVRAMEGYLAFVPARLPPAISYDDTLVLALSKADTALSELAGIGRSLPNPHMLISPYLRREAVLSSRIEGTQTNLSQLLQDEAEDGTAQRSERSDEDMREVRNYVAALEFGIELSQELPLSLRLVKQVHEKLMDGVRGENAAPGNFRKSQNWIGPTGSSGENAIFVPPPVREMEAALHDWELFLHSSSDIPDLVVCAMMHQQFETIHPFSDGNGRVGRLLITLFLIQRGRLPQPLLYLSAYFEAHRKEYYELLQQVRTDGEWANWLRFFLTGVTQISNQAVQQSCQLMDLREKFRTHLMDKPKALRLLDHLFINPYITVNRAEKLLDVTNPTARQVIKTMEKAGLLEEVSGRSWNRFYLVRPILNILEMPEVHTDDVPPQQTLAEEKAQGHKLFTSTVVEPQEDGAAAPKHKAVRRTHPAASKKIARQPNDGYRERWNLLTSDEKQPYLEIAQDEISASGISTEIPSAVENRAFNLWAMSAKVAKEN